jgi:nucleotide-binding universal stress UspA family protein
MAIKDLLVHLDQGPAAEGRLEAALLLAERFGAHVTGLYLVAEPFLREMAGRHMPADLLREHVAHAAAEAEAVLAAAQAEAGRRGVAWSAVRETGSLDRLPNLLARHARHADLAIVGQPDPQRGGVDDALLAEAAFMDSGRPALVVPLATTPVLPPRQALVAWDGSREAARAVGDALPLLQAASRVVVLVVDRRDVSGHAGEQPGAEISQHLARHGLPVELRQVESRGAGAAEVILAQVQDIAADLVVMGGYGHSRLREMLLGGTTRHMLEHANIPTLLAH